MEARLLIAKAKASTERDFACFASARERLKDAFVSPSHVAAARGSQHFNPIIDVGLPRRELAFRFGVETSPRR